MADHLRLLSHTTQIVETIPLAKQPNIDEQRRLSLGGEHRSHALQTTGQQARLVALR